MFLYEYSYILKNLKYNKGRVKKKITRLTTGAKGNNFTHSKNQTECIKSQVSDSNLQIPSRR